MLLVLIGVIPGLLMLGYAAVFANEGFMTEPAEGWTIDLIVLALLGVSLILTGLSAAIGPNKLTLTLFIGAMVATALRFLF